jgi:hypothetical protein
MFTDRRILLNQMRWEFTSFQLLRAYLQPSTHPGDTPCSHQTHSVLVFRKVSRAEASRPLCNEDIVLKRIHLTILQGNVPLEPTIFENHNWPYSDTSSEFTIWRLWGCQLSFRWSCSVITHSFICFFTNINNQKSGGERSGG